MWRSNTVLNWFPFFVAVVFLFFLAGPACAWLRADDGAASVAAGGIVMVREPRITMQKEVLRIGADKVAVEYEFRNDTDSDITTEVAFPVPPYSLYDDWHGVSTLGFDDFRLTISGKEAHYEIEAKAMLEKRNVSAQLKSLGINFASFGHYNEESHRSSDIQKLSAAQRAALIRDGLIDAEERPLWSVEKKYHWQQTFPAHSVVPITHSYTPVIGASSSIAYGLGPDAPPESKKELDSLCITPDLRKTLVRETAKPDNNVPFSYVDFILTTANTWKTPIDDFTLIVERPHEKGARRSVVSFCWDGPVTRIDADHFSAHASGFIPKHELRIGFISFY